jgi:diguanylate cyclase (GGDEF)-like protein
VNDTLGLAAGDLVLKLAAERLKAAVRNHDIVARLDGDEFAVMMHPATTIDETIMIANRILDLVQRTYLIEGHLVNIGVSIGIAQSPGDGNINTSLMRNANLALYHSKSSGRATYHFFEKHMEGRAQARRTSELELRQALALRQLELFYQPQVDTTNNRLLGFEALLRWRHPEKGLIPPGDFLPIAEEIGVILPIGAWVLRTACREAMNWPDHITVAVNASPLEFDAGNYAESVKQALADTGLAGGRLEVEITEGIMLRNDETVFQTLRDLRAMNVRITMDDFGTGYASLSQLARFPFDKIKIDRSLVGSDGDNPKQRAIVRAITTLGQSLGVSILAEGIEDADQLARLQSDGCTSVQGFLFSKPVPTSQLKDIFERFS